MNFQIDQNFQELLEKYDKNLKKFNQIHSLTKYENLNLIANDSIKALEFLDFYPKVAIDVGSGAGFPGIFLAIILKQCQWHLFEPNAKKASFLSYLKIDLGLKNVEIHRKKLQEDMPFIADLITSRALMKTKDLIKISKGFYDEKTSMLLYKGSSYESEIDRLDAKVFKGDDENRNYIIVRNLKCLQN